MPDVTFFCFWPEEDIFATEDYSLVSETLEFKIELEHEWHQILKVIS